MSVSFCGARVVNTSANGFDAAKRRVPSLGVSASIKSPADAALACDEGAEQRRPLPSDAFVSTCAAAAWHSTADTQSAAKRTARAVARPGTDLIMLRTARCLFEFDIPSPVYPVLLALCLVARASSNC